MVLFKVWNRTRDRKIFVKLPDITSNIYRELILKASEKLNIRGYSIVLESDGTVIDEDEILAELRSETLILLTEYEQWLPANTIDTLSMVTMEKASSVTMEKASSSDIDLSCPYVVKSEPESPNHSFVESDSPHTSSTHWNTFEIPWEKFPIHLIQACENGHRRKDTITAIVHIIVHELRGIESVIPTKVLRVIANEMVRKYPMMFADLDDEGTVMGDGSASILSKLMDRAAYLRRPPKRASTTGISTPPQFSKRKGNVTVGCVNWAPVVYKDASLNNDYVRQRLNNLHNEGIASEEFFNLLEINYAEQRLFLNDLKRCLTVNDIKKDYPVLFNKATIMWHFKKLTEVDLENIEINVKDKCFSIVKYGIEHSILKGIDMVFPHDQMSLIILAKLLKEDIFKCWYRIQVRDFDMDLENVIAIDTPCIVELIITENENVFMVYYQKQKILTSQNFLEALKHAFGLYFIMNLEYPNCIGAFLEMIQRYFLKMHPDSGSRSKKPRTENKVISLINKLRKGQILENCDKSGYNTCFSYSYSIS